jgi:hypothetical protein
MGKTLEAIDDDLAAWLTAQPLFFVATAPLAADGHVNCSPKGLDTFRVLGPREVAWLDLTGSGAETLAHLKENGRIVVMCCAFQGPPRIVRLHGRGTAHPLGSPGYAALRDRFPELPGARSIVRVEVTRIADSCGYAVPRMTLAGEREALPKWAEKRGEDGLATYRRNRNARSLDGLPAWEDS